MVAKQRRHPLMLLPCQSYRSWHFATHTIPTIAYPFYNTRRGDGRLRVKYTSTAWSRPKYRPNCRPKYRLTDRPQDRPTGTPKTGQSKGKGRPIDRQTPAGGPIDGQIPVGTPIDRLVGRPLAKPQTGR